MNQDNKNEGQEKIWVPPNLPGLDYPIAGSDDNISVASSVLEMADTIHLSKLEKLIAGGMLCVSEPVSEASDEDKNDSVVLLSSSKNHPDNQAFIFKPIEGSTLTVGSINYDRDLDEGTTSLGKIKTSSPNVTEDLRSKVTIDNHIETRQDAMNTRSKKVLRTKHEKIRYNEQSDDDGDFSATEGSDYICDSDEENKSTRKTNRFLTKCVKKTNSNNNNSNNNITFQAMVHAEKKIAGTSLTRVIVQETPETSFEENNVINSKQPILICNESIEKDPSVIHLDEKTYRSSGEKTKNDATENLRDFLNDDFDYDNVNINTSILEQNDLEYINKPSKSASQRSWNRRNCCFYCENLVTNFTRHLIRNHPEEIEVLKLMAITDPDRKVQKKRRQAFTDDLRNRGNYIHNSNVVSRNEGYLIPTRRKNDEGLNKSPSSFVVCKKCLGTYRRSTFYRHSKKCNPENENDVTMKHTLARHALSIIPTFTYASKEFQENIIPRLRNDEISLIVKQDPLIIAYGCRLLKKKKERRSRKAICSKMRDLAHLLKIVREKHPDIVQLQNLIDPKHYEYFIEAVKIMSGFNELTGFVEITSIPARIRPEILGCIEILFTNTIMDGNKSTALKDHIKNKLSEFKLLLEANWQWELSSNAEKTRKRNLMTKSQVMPLDKDIEKVMIKIHELEEKYYTDLKKEITNVSYENLCEVTIAHIILLDRKRSGDVAEAELQYYLNRKTDEIPPQVLETLDEKQKQAITDLDIFQIPGKRGRSVPVLLTKVMRRNIDVLIACRSTINISPENKYLFARPLTEEPFEGGRCLNRIKNMCNLKKPKMLTSTGLRHHIATLSQVHAKTDDKYTQHLATFLGHDMHVHASNYRLPLQAIQKGLVGSRLLEIEKHSKNKKVSNDRPSESDMSDLCVKEKENDKNEYNKKTKSDDDDETDECEHGEGNEAGICEYENECDREDFNINNKSKNKIEENESEKSELNEEIENDEYDKQNESGICKEKNVSSGKLTKKNNESSDYEENETETIKKKRTVYKMKGKLKRTKKKGQIQSSDTESSVDLPLKNKKNARSTKKILTDDESDEVVAEQKQKRRKKTHKKWSSTEVEAVMRHLNKYVVKKKNPGKAMCEEVLRKEPVLHNRTWMQINTYINNIYKKNL